MSKKILNIILFVLFILLMFCFYNIYKQFSDNKKTTNIIENVKKEVVIPTINNDEDIESNNEDTGLILERNFEKLLEINNETVAWINIENTDIDYPIVKANDNDYYLNHSFDKSINANGWIFMNYKNNVSFDDQNTIIFGHNTNGKSMFSELKNIYKGQNGNKISIYVYLKNKVIRYDTVSIYLTEENDVIPISTHFSDETIRNISKKSNIKFSIEPTIDDYFLTLSTCNNTTNQKIILHAIRK